MHHSLFVGLLALGLAFASPITAQAGEHVNYQSMTSHGFGDVATLMQNMTPEQRAAVMKQADEQMKTLRNLTPNQRAALIKQMKATNATLPTTQIDPNQLDYTDRSGIDAITNPAAASAR